jgi:hypothetical protein
MHACMRLDVPCSVLALGAAGDPVIEPGAPAGLVFNSLDTSFEPAVDRISHEGIYQVVGGRPRYVCKWGLGDGERGRGWAVCDRRAEPANSSPAPLTAATRAGARGWLGEGASRAGGPTTPSAPS